MIQIQVSLRNRRSQSPAAEIRRQSSQLPHLNRRLLAALNANLAQRAQRLIAAESKLRSLGPQATLERGYAIVTSTDGTIVREAAGLRPGQRLRTRLASGEFASEVVDD